MAAELINASRCAYVARWYLPTMRAFRVGGLRFLRVGRLQVSFCICRRATG